MFTREKGIALVAVIIVAVILAIMGLGALILAQQEAILTRIDADKAKAFYLAESGLAKIQESLQVPITGSLVEKFAAPIEETLEGGRYSVELVAIDSNYYAVSTGTSATVQKKVRAQVNFLAPPFENAVYAMNKAGGAWAFQLRGEGDPCGSGHKEDGGKDIINGNISVDGDVYLYEESSVKSAPAPNKWKLNGDVSATGSINVATTATISGARHPGAGEPELIDVMAMDYANNNTHNVAQIFGGVTSGYPSSGELKDVFVKNPSDRKTECATTTVDDYFCEPSSGFVTGGWKTGDTPLHMGKDRVYYVDGDVWFYSKPTYGFKMDGRATIVATGDIHLCDNLEYADVNSLLGLVALGKYGAAGNLISGGNIYFGDPVYGNMYIFSAMMFAANDFLFNTDRITRKPAEPDTGFVIMGCFSAMNQVSIVRDWYSSSKPARYDPATGKWFDVETGADLGTSPSQLRHYQMIINYDDRVRSRETQPPLLPRGGTHIFAGFSNWEEL